MTPRTLLVALCLVLLTLVAPHALGQDQANASKKNDVQQDYVVIGHPDLPLDELDLSDLRAILLGKQRFWPGGQRVHLVINGLRESPGRVAWVYTISSMTEVQFTQYWIGMVFRGRATSAPHAVPDEATAAALVEALPGAISVVTRAPETNRVKVVDILSASSN